MAGMRRAPWVPAATVVPVPEDETEETYGKRLGAVITELRLARGMKRQADLAERMGRHLSTIQRWETAQTMPNAWNIRELADALGVDVGTLLYPPDVLSPEILAVSRAAGATVRREMAKRASRRARLDA